MACAITFPVLILLPLLVMVVRSLRVKTGRGPTCPKCRFNLYKLDTDHCPECGYPIAEKGVLPPHRINRMSICLELIGVSFLVTVLSLLVGMLAHSIGHYEALNSSVYFKYPRSCGYEQIEVAYGGEAFRWGPPTSAYFRSTAKMRLDYILIEVTGVKQVNSLRVNPSTLACYDYVTGQLVAEKITKQVLSDWIKANGMDVPVPIFRKHLVMGTGQDLSFFQIMALPVGELGDELDQVMDYVN